MSTPRQAAIASRALARVGAAATFAVDPPPPTQDASYVQAYSLALAAGLTPSEAQAAVAIGQFESYLGLKAQWLLPDGTPTYNWGALRASPSDPSFIGPQGAPWMRFPSMRAGLTRFLAFGSVKRARAYFAQGDMIGGVAQMFDDHYWVCQKGREPCVREYAAGVLQVARAVAKANGTPLFLDDKGALPPAPQGSAPSSIGGVGAGTLLMLAAGLAAGAYVYVSGSKAQKHRAETAAPAVASVVAEEAAL